MDISRGEHHQFLGMEIEVNGGKVGLSMKRQLNKMISEFEAKNGSLDTS